MTFHKGGPVTIKNARLVMGDSEPFLARPRPLPPIGEGAQSFKMNLQYTGTLNYAALAELVQQQADEQRADERRAMFAAQARRVMAEVQTRIDEEGCGAVMGAMKRWDESL